MAEKLKRAVVKFCFLLGKTVGETVVTLETAYKEAAMGKTQVYEWFSRFRNGELSLADQPRSGRPSTSRTDENIARIRELILEDRRRTIDDLVDLYGVSWSSCQRILREELQSGEWWLHHDNAPAHKALNVKQFLTKNSMTQLLRPPYSPDLAPCDFFLFPPNEKSPQRKTFCGRGRGEERNDEGIKRHHFARISGLLRKVENTFRPVHCIKWTVLWRWLNL